MKNTFTFLFAALLVFTSTDILRAQWVQTNGPYGGPVFDIAISGPNIFAATEGGVFLSTNNGGIWQAVNNGLSSTIVYSLITNGTNIFAAIPSGGGIYRSTNNGTNWTQVLSNVNVTSFAVSGTNIFTNAGGVRLSTNNGTSWTQVNSGLTNTNVTSLSASGTNIFAGTNGGGVYISTNNGTNWTQVNNGLTNTVVWVVSASGTNIFAGTQGGIFLSTNNGASWTRANNGLGSAVVEAITISGTNIFAATDLPTPNGVFLSTNNGTNWVQVNNGLTNTDVRSLSASGTNIYAGTSGGMFFSTNNGTNWTTLNNGLTNTGVFALTTNGTNIFAGTRGSAFLSTNNGTNWTQQLANTFIQSFAVSGTNIFAGSVGGAYRSTNNGASWSQINNGLTNTDVTSLCVSGTSIIAGTAGGGVYRSTNNGTNWTQINNGLTNTQVTSLSGNSTNIIAGTWGGMFLSTNNGTNWTEVLADISVSAFAVSGTNIFAGTYNGDGVFLSTNNGTTWTQVNNGLTTGQVYSLTVSGTNIFAGCYGVYLSTNYGTNWTQVSNGLTNKNVYSLTISGANIYAGTVGGTGGGGSGVWRRPLSEMIAYSVALISPGSSATPGYTISTLTPSFFWNAVPSASNYGLQLYKQNGSSYDLVYNSDNITTTSVVLPAGTITDASQYYWQVRARVNNVWSSFSFPYYFNVSVASLTPTISLSSSVIQTGAMMTFTGINFTSNNQAKAIITSNNGYNTSITLNTNATGYLTHTLTFPASGSYTIYCKDVSTQNLSNSKSFDVRNAAPVSYFSIILPTSGYQANVNEPILVEWKDKLETGTAYPIVGSQRGYNFLVEKSTNGGSGWQVAETVSGFDDINNIRNFSARIIIGEPSSNCLIRVRDGYVSTRTTANVPIQILSTTPSTLTASFIWDYSYPTNIGQPVGAAADGTSRFYIKVSDPGNTITQVTFSLFDADNNNETRTLGKVKAATNTTSYDEEANTANQLSIPVTQPHANNEFWCWYVAPDDFIGLNTAIGHLTTREVKVKIRAEYASAPFKEKIETITIKRPPVVLVHGLNSDVTMWNIFAATPSFSAKFHRYRLEIGGKVSLDNNARRILIPTSSNYDPYVSIPGAINDFRRSGIACSQVYYVGHSMGGIVLRYAETYYPNNFLNQKNYRKGYVNKFISLDTPHKGSPFANLLNISRLPISSVDIILLGVQALDDYYVRDNLTRIITDVHPAIRDLRMNSFDINATPFKSHVFIGDMIEGSETFWNLPPSFILDLNVTPSFFKIVKLLYYLVPLPTYGIFGSLDLFYNNLSGSSISNTDLIVPLNSQLSDLPQSSSLATYTVNFHSEATGSPSIEMNSADAVAALLDKPMSSAVWGSLPELHQSSSGVPSISVAQNILLDSSFIDVFAPRNLDTLYIDSVFNLTFSLSDTSNLKKITIVYQDKFIEDTIRQTNYNYSLSVSNNFIDTQSVTILALYLSNDSTTVSSRTIPVIIKPGSNPIAIKSKESFVYLLKDEEYYPEVDIYFETFIGKIGTTGTPLDVVVADPGLLSFDSRTKTITALQDGGTFAVFEYRGLKDTVYFKINGETITGVLEDDNNSSSGMPDKFELLQNYPNPFNPFTTIRYDLPTAAQVTLKIYNMLGQEVKTLVDEIQMAGRKTIQWDSRNNAGNSVASGVYFYRMQAADFVQTKKLVLLR